ncbi:hypothetical protein [Saccharothrix sp.]|uniref:hypothetical protein n=1 Tax=Saccharothrix sp. TaxID=1873460 RepID=UPI002810C5BB|nr:hypothetical protein [Saccharothrix sp.]
MTNTPNKLFRRAGAAVLAVALLAGAAAPAGAETLPGPHAHGYHRHQDGGEWKVVDVVDTVFCGKPAN